MTREEWIACLKDIEERIMIGRKYMMMKSADEVTTIIDMIVVAIRQYLEGGAQ